MENWKIEKSGNGNIGEWSKVPKNRNLLRRKI